VSRKLLNFFPKEYEPSTIQIDVIKQIDEAFSANHKYCIVSAPTGTGKSFIASTLSNASNGPTTEFINLVNSYDAYKQDYLGNYTNQVECENQPPFGTFTLTITKSLQDQYKELFNETSVLKGKNNYICDIDKESSVEIAPCLIAPRLKDDCWKANRCPYYNARNNALVSKNSVLNYKMFLHLPRHMKRKNYIVCDEASELENELVKTYSLTIDASKLQSLGIKVKKQTTNIKKWLEILLVEISIFIDAIIKKTNNDAKLVIGEKNKIYFLQNLYWQINQCISEWDDCEWVIDELDKNTVTITPLKVNTLAKHIFNCADQIVLMSATIIDHKKFAESLGIEKYKFIEGRTNFDPKQSPIYLSNKNCLNYKNKQEVMPRIAKQIKEICELYRDKKGIIHTHNLEITNLLNKSLKDKRFLFRNELNNNEKILNQHYNSADPTVLVSPSLTHGVDLRDDLARFCIIVKLPYLPLNNKRIKKLFEKDKNWYLNQMLKVLVQMCGRSTRSRHDYSTTYILDGNGYKVLPDAKHKLPEHFFSRIN
jgi:Rad3-related DNA helicase